MTTHPKPLVSLVTGCYNGEKFIRRYFDSVINQTFENIELIIVNDGSIDSSLEIIKSYIEPCKANNISLIIIDQENQGYYTTSGIKIASGEYITTLDIDDYLMPTSIEERVSFMEANSEFSVVRTNGYEVFENNLDDTSRLFIVDESEKTKTDIFEDLLFGNTNNWAGSYMVRSSVLFAQFPDHIVPGTRFGQNLQILMPCAYHRKSGFIDKPLMKYIRTKQSFTISAVTYEKQMLQMQNYKSIRLSILDLLNISDNELKYRLDQIYLHIYMNIARNFYREVEFNTFYAQINNHTIVDKIQYHSVNKNKIRQFIFKVLNKLNFLITLFKS